MTHTNIAKVSKKLWGNVTIGYSILMHLQHFFSRSNLFFIVLIYCLSSFDRIRFNLFQFNIESSFISYTRYMWKIVIFAISFCFDGNFSCHNNFRHLVFHSPKRRTPKKIINISFLIETICILLPISLIRCCHFPFFLMKRHKPPYSGYIDWFGRVSKYTKNKTKN